MKKDDKIQQSSTKKVKTYVYLPKELDNWLEEMVEKGYFYNKSHGIEVALRLMKEVLETSWKNLVIQASDKFGNIMIK